MTTQTEQAIGQWLEGLAASNQSNEQDSVKMANLLHRIGFPQAVVVCGIVYLEGKGTLETPPASINHLAKILVSYEGKIIERI